MTDEKTSSEEKEQELAQEALEATADEGTPPVEKPVDEPLVPLHKVTALRTRAQMAEIAQARAEGELAGIRQAQAPPAKSPLDVEIARQAAEGIAEEDMTISPKVIRAHELYKEQVANQEAAARAAQELAVQQQVSKAKAIAVHDDWYDVIAAGQALLTPGELVDLNAAGVDFGESAYKKCIEAIERNKPAQEAAPEKKPDESEAEKKAREAAEAAKVPSQEEILAEVGGDPDAVRASQL
jgi:hypothetical protein